MSCEACTNNCQTPKSTALPHDGWRSRKIIVGMSILGVLSTVGAACMFILTPGAETPIASFDQWSGFVKVIVPSVLVPLFGALGVDKIAESRAVK
jgi:hypothetical protein